MVEDLLPLEVGNNVKCLVSRVCLKTADMEIIVFWAKSRYVVNTILGVHEIYK